MGSDRPKPNNEVINAASFAEEHGVPDSRAAERRCCSLAPRAGLFGSVIDSLMVAPEEGALSESSSFVTPSSSLRSDAIDNAFKTRRAKANISYREDDEVEVWSPSKRMWLVGYVSSVLGADGGERVPQGSVKVEYAGLQKWIAPKDFESTIRHYVPCEAPRDAKALPPCVLRALRLRFYIEAGAGGRPSWAARTLLRAHELLDLWSRAEEEEAWRHGAARESQRIDEQVEALFADVGAKQGHDLETFVDVHEFTHHALLLAHPPGPVALKALRAKLALPSPSVRLPQIVSRWMQMDVQGIGLVALGEFAEALQKELKIDSDHAERWALTMLRALGAEGDGHASYSEFVACCLGLRYAEVHLHWYDLSNDWARYLSLLLGSWEEGLWHTSISVFGREYFLDGGRIAWSAYGASVWGRPVRAQKLGITTKSLDEVREFVFMDLDPQFDQQSYDAVDHNCNHFTDKLAKFLLGAGIPGEILSQPQRLMGAPGAWMITPFIDDWLGEDMRTQHEGIPTGAKNEAVTHGGFVVPRSDVGDGSTSAGTPSEDDAKAVLSSDSNSSGGASDSEADRVHELFPMTKMHVKVNPPNDPIPTPRAHRRVSAHVAA